MSDIAGPPAPKEIQPSVRGADKLANVAKDPNQTNARTPDQQNQGGTKQQTEAQQTRDPAVSIASSAAKLEIGQELRETVAKADAEGRPIIITDTATFALKPDAGLKENDAVVLKIVEVENRISANLLSQNAHVFDPPIQVSLTVTHIYNQQNTATSQQTAINTKPYQPPLSAFASKPTDTESVLFAATKQTPSPNTKTLPPLNTVPVVGTTTTGVEHTAPIGMTKLIVAQEGSHAPAVQTTLTKSTLTTAPQALNGAGIGPAIMGISLSGAPAIMQVLDPSLSSVPPRELATVTNVAPFTAEQAITLSRQANLRSTFGSETALSTVETSQGSFIAPSQDVGNLTGELIRLAVGAPEANPIATQQFHPAIFIEAKEGGLPQKVSVTFSKPEAPMMQEHATYATINAVHTQAAFLSSDGPKADIRLDTSRGDISLTIPSAFRPLVGDIVHIFTPESLSQAASAAALPQTVPIPVTPQPEITNTQVSLPDAPVQNVMTNWPALQESIAVLAANNPAAASLLQDKTAQGGGKLTNSLLFFLAAAGRTGPSAWTGQKVDQALQNTSGSLLKQLHSDIRQMANLATDTSGEWRTILLPVDARSSEVPLAALLIQQNSVIDPDESGNNQKNNNDEKNQGERFILQVQFSVLGDIQLDGRIQQQQFDLTVRSAKRFNAPLENELKNLFHNSLAANGYAGSLAFEEQYPFPVDAHAIIEGKLMSGDKAL